MYAASEVGVLAKGRSHKETCRVRVEEWFAA